MNTLILFIFIIILIIGFIKKINCYETFLEGSFEGLHNTVNMFSTLLTFQVAISIFTSSGIIEFLENKLSFNYSYLIIQMIVRPFSSSSSLSIMLKCYELYGSDGFISLLSTGIHYISDASIYIIPFYLSTINIKKFDKLLLLGLFVNLFSYFVVILLISIFIV